VVPTRANAQPAFGCYTPESLNGVAHASGLFVLTFQGDGATAITWFANPALFSHFGLPESLGALDA
jgi:RNA polymerase sigma-70 factor (ECF subfamily)